MNQLHPGAKWVFRFRTYFSSIIILFMLSIWGGEFFRQLFGMIGVLYYYLFVGFFILIFAIIIGEVYAHLAYKFWKYQFTDTELKIERGIIFKVYTSIPYERVQNVDIYRGILARISGFSTLNIQTAGYHYAPNNRTFAEGHIPALSVNEAEKMREFLMKKIGKKQGL